MTVVQYPEDIVVEILLRLPVESLLRFKDVDPSWDSIISGDRFIREHLKLAKAATDNQHQKFLGIMVPGWKAGSTCVLLKEDSGGLIAAKKFDFPVKNLAATEEKVSLRICNSCDGFICFRMGGNIKATIIWNPSIPTEYKVIDSASFTGSPAIGYDPRTNDYKIVLMPHYSGLLDDYLDIHLFSLKSESWTTLKLAKPVDLDHGLITRTSICAKNRLHWLAGDRFDEDSDESDEDGILFMIYFDMAENSFNYLNLPAGIGDVVPMNYKGSLAIAQVNPEGQEKLWVLQEYRGMKSSWKNIFNISCSCLPKKRCFSMTGDIIICRKKGLAVFNTNDGSVKEIAIEGNNENYCDDIFATSYIESLLSPRRLQ